MKKKFEWAKFLFPTTPRLVITLALPVLVVLVVTGSLDTLMDFYGYLLWPVAKVYSNGQLYTTLNYYALLWIPLYVFSCLIYASCRGFNRGRKSNAKRTQATSKSY